MTKVKSLSPFHEEYLANTVAQVKDLLWAQFEEENKDIIKDEPYEYKTEDIIYQDRIVAEDQNYRDLLKYILGGGKIKFQKEKLIKTEIDTSFGSVLRRPVTDYSEDGDSTGSYWDLGKKDRELYDKLDPLCHNRTANRRAVLSLIEYPESWIFVYKKSRIGFQEVALKKQSILKIFNRNSTSEKKGYSSNEGLFKLKITKSGFVRYFNGQSTRWLSLRNWHNTKLPFKEEVLRLLVSINPNNEFLRGEQKDLILSKYNIGNKDLRKITNWKTFYKNLTGFYREQIPLLVAQDLANKIPKNSLESFLARIDKGNEVVPSIKEARFTWAYSRSNHFEEIYYRLLTGLSLKKKEEYSFGSGLIRDAYRMAKELDEEFNLKIESANKFKEYHDDLAKRHRLKALGPLTAHDKFKILKSGKYEVECIDTGERLIKEAQELHHCVSSYASMINVGTCGIYSIFDGINRWTLELQCSDGKIFYDWDGKKLNKGTGFFINQCRGLHNKSAPKEIFDFIQDQLDEINKEKQ